MDKAILELCDRFGVGVEKLIPQVINFGQVSSDLSFKISIALFFILAGIFLLALFIRIKVADPYSTPEFVCDVILILTGIAIVACFVCVLWNGHDYYMWMHSPRIMAIRYILSSIGGN